MQYKRFNRRQEIPILISFSDLIFVSESIFLHRNKYQLVIQTPSETDLVVIHCKHYWMEACWKPKNRLDVFEKNLGDFLVLIA